MSQAEEEDGGDSPVYDYDVDGALSSDVAEQHAPPPDSDAREEKDGDAQQIDDAALATSPLRVHKRKAAEQSPAEAAADNPVVVEAPAEKRSRTALGSSAAATVLLSQPTADAQMSGAQLKDAAAVHRVNAPLQPPPSPPPVLTARLAGVLRCSGPPAPELLAEVSDDENGEDAIVPMLPSSQAQQSHVRPVPLVACPVTALHPTRTLAIPAQAKAASVKPVRKPCRLPMPEASVPATGIPVPPVPAASLSELNMREAWTATATARRSFRFPFLRAELARPCFPLNLQMASFDMRLRVAPLIPLPPDSDSGDRRRTFDARAPVRIFGRLFAQPLLQAAQWAEHGCEQLCRLMRDSPSLQRDLIHLHQTRCEAFTRMIFLGIDESSKEAEIFLRKEGHTRHPTVELLALEKRVQEAEEFLAYLNAFVLSPAFQKPSASLQRGSGFSSSMMQRSQSQAPQQPDQSFPELTEHARLLFVLTLGRHALTLFHLSTSIGLVPSENCFTLRSREDEFGSRVASCIVQFQMQMLCEILWLYDQHLLKYDLRRIEAHRVASLSAQSAPSPSVAGLRHSASSDAPPYEGPAFFPFFSFVEHLMQSLLALSHRHPNLCVATSSFVEHADSSAPAAAIGASKKQWLWHPILSCWLKLQESLEAFDHTLLFHPQDAHERMRSFGLLWNSEETDAQSLWLGTTFVRDQGAPTTTTKHAALEKHLLALGKLKQLSGASNSINDVTEPALSFWIFFRVVAERMLDVPVAANPTATQRTELPPVQMHSAENSYTVTELTRSHELDIAIVRRALLSLKLSDDAPAMSPARAADATSATSSSVADRLDTLFEVLFRVVLPIRSEGFFSSQWQRSFTHRMLDASAMQPTHRAAPAAAWSASQVRDGVDALEEEQPFLLLACTSAPLDSDSSDAALSPAALLRTMLLHTGWPFFDSCFKRLEQLHVAGSPSARSDAMRSMERLLVVQQHSLLTARNHTAEGRFIMRTLLQSRFVVDDEPPRADVSGAAQAPPRRGGSADRGQLLHYFSRENAPKYSTGDSSGAVAQDEPTNAFLSIALELLRHYLLRACRPLSYWATLLGLGSIAPLSSVTIEVVGALELRARRLMQQAEQLVVSSIVELCSDARANLWTLKPLAVVVPEGQEAFFSHKDGGSISSHASANLAALKRRLSLLLVVCQVLSRQAQAPLVSMLSQLATPLAPVLATGSDSSAQAQQFLPSLTPKSNASSRSRAFLLVFHAVLQWIRLRQGWVNLYSSSVAFTLSQRAKVGTAQLTPAQVRAKESLPPLHGFSLLKLHDSNAAVSVRAEDAWLLNFSSSTALAECGYQDLLSLLVSLTLAPVWEQFMIGELRRVSVRDYQNRLSSMASCSRVVHADGLFFLKDMQTNALSQSEINTRIKEAVRLALEHERIQAQRESFLVGVLSELVHLMERKKQSWTVNELEILKFVVATPALEAAPAVAPVAPGHRPPQRIVVEPSPFVAMLLHVHGAHTRISPALRRLGIQLLSACIPTGSWVPMDASISSVRTGGKVAAASSMLDDGDDDAFAAIDVDAKAVVASVRASPAAAQSQQHDAARMEQDRAREAEPAKRALRSEYGHALATLLQKHYSVKLHQLMCCNLHIAARMQSRATELAQQTIDSKKLAVVSVADGPVNPASFAASVVALGGVASASIPVSVVSADHPVTALPSHYFPSDGSLQLVAVEAFIGVCYVLVAGNKMTWTRILELYFPRLAGSVAPTAVQAPPPKAQSSPSSSSSAPVIKSFPFADVVSPLREMLLLHFYTGLLEGRRGPQSFALRPLRGQPQLFLSLWIQSMLDMHISLGPALACYTRAILEYTSVGAPGSTALAGVAHSPLADFFPRPTRAMCLKFIEVQGYVGDGKALNGTALTLWFKHRKMLIEAVLDSYARKCSPHPSQIALGSAPRRIVPDAVGSSAPNSQSLLSIFHDLPSLLRRQVSLLAIGFATDRATFSEEFYSGYLRFMYEALAAILEKASECLVPGSMPNSLSSVQSLFKEFMRVDPFGVTAAEMYTTSISALPAAVRCLAWFLPVPLTNGGSSDPVGAPAFHDVRAILNNPKKGTLIDHLLMDLWKSYLQLVHVQATAEKFADPHTNTFVQEKQRKGTDLKRTDLFEAWRKALMPLMDVANFKGAAAAAAAPSPVRVTQHNLLRRYMFSVHFSHALLQAVLVKEGDVRMGWASELIRHVLWPTMMRLKEADFIIEFRILLPIFMSLLFQVHSFVSPKHQSAPMRPAVIPAQPVIAPAPAVAAAAHVWQSSAASVHSDAPAVPVTGNSVKVWTASTGAFCLRRQVVEMLSSILRASKPLSLHASASSLWLSIFGPSPFELDSRPALPSGSKSSGTLLLELLVESMLIDVRVCLADREENLLPTEKNEVRDRRSTMLSKLSVLASRDPFACGSDRVKFISSFGSQLPPLTMHVREHPGQAVFASEMMRLISSYFDFFQMLGGVALEGPPLVAPRIEAVVAATLPPAAAAPAVPAPSVATTASLPSTPSSVLSCPAASLQSTPRTSASPSPTSKPSQATPSCAPSPASARTPPTSQSAAAGAAASPHTPASNPWQQGRAVPAPRVPSVASAPRSSAALFPCAAPASTASVSSAPASEAFAATSLWETAPPSADRGPRRWVLYLLRKLHPMMEPPAGAAGIPVPYQTVRHRYKQLLQSLEEESPHAHSNLGLTLKEPPAPTPAPAPARPAFTSPRLAVLNLAL